MRHIRFSVHPFAAAGLFLLLFAMPRTYAFAVISSVFLHEAGHAAAALLLGHRIETVRLMPAGMSIGLSPSSSYRAEFLIAAAGPLLSLAYAAASYLMPQSVGMGVRSVTMSLAVLNLLPVKTLDGGRMAGALLSCFFGEAAAARVLAVSSVVCLSVLWILALYIFFYSGVNFTLLLFCAYLFSYLVVKRM